MSVCIEIKISIEFLPNYKNIKMIYTKKVFM